MAIGINIENEKDENHGHLARYLEDYEDESLFDVAVRLRSKKKKKDENITSFTHLKKN